MGTNRSGKGRRVVKYRRRRHINVGMIVFAVIFIYIAVYMAVYLTRDKVTIYEVVMGKNAGITNKSYRGLVLRDESVVNADTSGYLNYFVKEGERVSLSSTVYTLDESGTINSILSNASDNGDIVFSSENELELRNLISEHTKNQSDTQFDSIYDFKQTLDSKIMECINLNNIKQLLDSSNENGGIQFRINKAVRTGVVSYCTDGYEGKTESTLVSGDFDTEGYSRTLHSSGSLIEAGTPVYKVAGSEDWSVYIRLSDEETEKYKDTDVIRIKILSDGREINGNFSIVNIDGQAYGRIDMVRYMGAYITERFLDVQIVEKQVEGLKIPKTSVVEKDFYTIPLAYAGRGGDSTSIGFYKKVYDENQKESVVFITPTIYYVTDEYYYVDAGDGGDLKDGDFVVMPDSSDSFRISAKGTLKGAYNVNNGYCMFRNVNVLTETGDYYLVETDSAYGLKVFDHIVINGSMVKEKQVVFSVN